MSSDNIGVDPVSPKVNRSADTTKNLKLEEGGPTEYGATDPGEDFAESFWLYMDEITKEDLFKKSNPERYRFIEEILKDFPEEKISELILRSLLSEKEYKTTWGVLRPSGTPSLKEE